MSLFDSLPDIPQGIKDAGNNLYAGTNDAIDSVKNFDFASKFDPAGTRLDIAKLIKGGVPRSAKAPAKAKFSGEITDWRVKISLATDADYFYKDSDPGILAPLVNTGGVIFPYTPQISMTHTAKYGAQSLTHSNYTNYSYEGSEVQAISITGDFTAQNSTEAAYVLACIHFFRSCTKMWWGKDAKAGAPPPMVFLTGYGDSYFPNVPCVITSIQHTMPQDVDYVQANTAVNFTTPNADNNKTLTLSPMLTTMVPTSSQIQISLQPIYSRKNIYNNFSLDAFAKGQLIGGYMGRGTGFI